jgi:hypothetical protein
MPHDSLPTLAVAFGLAAGAFLFVCGFITGRGYERQHRRHALRAADPPTRRPPR